MNRNPDSASSVSIDATSPKFNRLVPDRESDGTHAAAHSPTHCRSQRSRGWMSGLLTIGLLAIVVFVAPSSARAESIAVGISVRIAPPPIPVYTQPVCPGPGYLWTPGYWAYDPANGYFWVPGTWVMAPAPGLLWTPGYWGWDGGAFIFHAGYWGPHVGFYGGINYGFGYMGVGFVGGEWRGGSFFYNRSVNNFGRAHFANVYYRPVANNFAVNRVSYNGGAGGLGARPSTGELAAEHDRHIEATSTQRQHEMAAHNERSQFASENHGRPSVAATGRPGEFRGGNVVASTRAGGAVTPGGFHRSNPGNLSGTRSPNPGGGGTHQVMTAHSNSPASHSYGTRQGGTAPGPNHSISAPHNEASHGAASNHPPAPSHQQKATQHDSRPSEGERREPHGK